MGLSSNNPYSKDRMLKKGEGMGADDLPCSRNTRSKTPLVGRPHYGDQPGYPRREGEKEKARIKKFAAGLVGCFGWRAAIRDSAEVQLASNEWPGLSMSMTSGA